MIPPKICIWQWTNIDPNKNNINLNAHWNCINNPNQHGSYNKPSGASSKHHSSQSAEAICFNGSRCWVFTLILTALKKKSMRKQFPPQPGIFSYNKKTTKKQYEIQFQLQNYTPIFPRPHMNPHQPTSSRRAKLCANHMSATMEARGGSWYLGDIFCSEADMAMQSKPSAGLLVPQVQVGVENNGNIYNIYIYIHDVGMLPSPCQDASDHHDCYRI